MSCDSAGGWAFNITNSQVLVVPGTDIFLWIYVVCGGTEGWKHVRPIIMCICTVGKFKLVKILSCIQSHILHSSPHLTHSPPSLSTLQHLHTVTNTSHSESVSWCASPGKLSHAIFLSLSHPISSDLQFCILNESSGILISLEIVLLYLEQVQFVN